MLGRFDRLDRDEFDVDDDTLNEVAEAVARWRAELEDEG